MWGLLFTVSPMENFEFYKGLFDKEQDRKSEIENSVNISVGILTIIVATVYFLVRDTFANFQLIEKILLVLNALSVSLSVVYLSKSFNNLFKGFRYENLPNTKELRDYQIKLHEKHQKSGYGHEKFESYLLENYVEMTDINFKINRTRLNNLYLGKTFMILSIALTIGMGIVLIINNIKGQ